MNKIPLDRIPVDWLIPETTYFALSEFEYFLINGKYDDVESDELKRLQILIKEGVEGFLEPIIKNGHYKNITQFTLQEIENFPDLSDEKYNRLTEFFKRSKSNNIEFGGRKISLFKLKEFTPINRLKKIPLIVCGNILHQSKSYRCNICSGTKKITMSKQVPNTRRRNIQRFTPRQGDSMGEDNDEPAYTTEYYEVACTDCDADGNRMFSSKAFEKVVEEYDYGITNMNNRIADLNEKSIELIKEYNNTIQELNKKIRIWNSKCPHDATDTSHQSKDDRIKYWHQKSDREVTTDDEYNQDVEKYNKNLLMLKGKMEEREMKISQKSKPQERDGFTHKITEEIEKFHFQKRIVFNMIERATSKKDKDLLGDAVDRSRVLAGYLVSKKDVWANEEIIEIKNALEQIRIAFETKASTIGLNVNSIKNYKHFLSDVKKGSDKIKPK